MPNQPTSPEALISAIEGTALLGRGLREAEVLRTRLSRHLGSHPDPALLLRQRLHFGSLLMALESSEATAWLRDLAREAAARGQPSVAQRANLMAARACCLAGEPEAGALLLAAAEEQPIVPEASLDHLLAWAWLGTLDAVRLLAEALERLPPARDHDRMAVLLELADRCEEGGDPYRARDALQQALHLARHHDAHRHAGRAALLLGGLLLRSGAPAAADQALHQAMEEATMAEDSHVQAAAGTLAVALLLGQGAWQPLLDLSASLLEVARKRKNPALLASLALDRATAHAGLAQPDRAVRELLVLGQELELAGEDLALNLIKARLVALLQALGPHRFGALVLEAMGGEPQPPGPGSLT